MPAANAFDFRELVELTRDAIIVRRRAGDILFWSAGAERLYGWTASQAVGRLSQDLLATRFSVPTAEIEEALDAGGGWEGVLHRTTAAGAAVVVASRWVRQAGSGDVLFEIDRDETERYRLEQVLRVERQQFERFTSQLPIMVAQCDRDVRFRYANEAYAARFGLTPRDLVGRPADEIIGPEALAASAPYVAVALAGQQVAYETWVPYRTLGRRYIRCLFSPEIDADGQVLGFVAGVLDDTARKHAEDALLASRARFEFVASSADIGVWSCDLPFADLIWNTAVKAHFGLDPDAAVTIDTFYERIHPDDVATTRAAIDAALGTGVPYDVQYRTRQQDGSFRWIRAIGRAECDEAGVAKRFEGITIDIDQTMQTAAALVDSRDRLRAALDASVTGTFRWDIESNALDWDENLDRLFGLAPGSTAQSLSEFVRLVHPDDRTRVIDACTRCAAEGVDFVEEFRVVWPDGTVRWLFDQGRVLTSADGHRRMIGACVDVTERRVKEDALRAADRQKDEFLGMLAHEIRNPLAPVVYAAAILDRAIEDPALKRPLDIIQRQATRMTRIVDDLLDISRVTQGKILLRHERVLVERLLAQSVEATRPLFQSRRHVLVLHPIDPALAVLGDPVRLAQIVENLLVNAAKYTPDGGRVDVWATAAGHDVSLVVQDTGVGIDQKMLGQVFDLFAQANTSLDRAEGGLGIGLTLVDRLARMHGGRAHAGSAGLGHGSTFTVTLPQLQGADGPRPAPASGAGDTRGRRVLVIDDNRDAAETLCALLTACGHEVRLAHEGDTAVRLASAFVPDVVLLDIGLPHKDGYQVIRDLRGVPAAANAIIIATTGYGREEDRLRCLAAGFDEHATKPVDVDRLLALLARAS